MTGRRGRKGGSRGRDRGEEGRERGEECIETSKVPGKSEIGTGIKKKKTEKRIQGK